jgi:ABC transporter
MTTTPARPSEGPGEEHAGPGEDVGRPGGAGAPAPRQGGPAAWMNGPSLEPAKDFKGSMRRLFAMLRPERTLLIVTTLLGVGAVAASVLGQATNIIFDGFVSKNLPAGESKAQIIAGLQAKGQTAQADLLRGAQLTPGHGIAFDSLGRTLGEVALIYLVALVLGVAQGRMTAINYVLVAVVGGLRVASGALSLGDVQAFIQYSRQFSQPLTQVASMTNMLQSGAASAERIFAVLDADEQQPDRPDAVELETVTGRVAFEHVSFSYSKDKPLITDLSLTVEPGQTVAIVGPTGAGKTTTMRMILGLDAPTRGSVTVGGRSYRDLPAPMREAGALLDAKALHGGRQPQGRPVPAGPALAGPAGRGPT